MEKSIFFDHIRVRYGFVKRCRGPYLYTSKEVRLTDLYQEGGRAVLGWRSGKSMQVLKNTLEKGLWGDYPSVSVKRLEKALTALFSGCKGAHYTHFSWYFDISQSLRSFPHNTPPVLFPWSNISAEGITVDAETCLLIPPFPYPSIVIGASVSNTALPPSDSFSSSILEALTRSIYDLMYAFDCRTDEAWALYDDILSPYFIRKGSALYTTLSHKDYESFVLHCLDCGLVVNPSPEYPSFIPYGADKGVFLKLKKAKFVHGGVT